MPIKNTCNGSIEQQPLAVHNKGLNIVSGRQSPEKFDLCYDRGEAFGLHTILADSSQVIGRT
jgi:hypothetical protein